MQRIVQFFMEVRAELSKVIWPSRIQTINYTLLVIGISVAVAAVLGAADYGLLKALEKVVNR